MVVQIGDDERLCSGGVVVGVVRAIWLSSHERNIIDCRKETAFPVETIVCYLEHVCVCVCVNGCVTGVCEYV